MKIPFTAVIISLFLSGCNSAKLDNPRAVSANPPVARSPADVASVAISTKYDLRAAFYVVGDAAMVHVDGQPEQRLTGINPTLYPDYRPAFFRLRDKNHDGISEIAVLASTSFGAADLCYDVFHYNLASGKFTRKLEDFYCTHG